jgi:hypothetical protein
VRLREICGDARIFLKNFVSEGGTEVMAAKLKFAGKTTGGFLESPALLAANVT